MSLQFAKLNLYGYKLAALGASNAVISEIMGLPGHKFKSEYVKPEKVHRDGVEWIKSAGEEKAAADRLLKYIISITEGNISRIPLTAEKLIEGYEGFVAMYPNMKVTVSFNRYHRFCKRLSSKEFAICKCKSCGNSYITDDARVRHCGICLLVNDHIKSSDQKITA